MAEYSQSLHGHREINMTLITIFTSPKPFTDPHIRTIQLNALRSWVELGSDVKVLMLGDEEGMSEVAADLGIDHIKEIECNKLGTPLISSLFSQARENSNSELLAYVNADIILLPDFVETAKEMISKAEKFLLLGQRWDLEIKNELDFKGSWQEKLTGQISKQGRLHPPSGSDYFIYPRNVFLDIPDFLIGRAGWDNWFIYRAVTQPWLAVDATKSITVIHQDHDYSHLPDSKPHYFQPETQDNIKLAGGRKNMYFLYDVEYEIKGGQISKIKKTLFHFIRAIERLIHPDGVEPSGLRWELTLMLSRFRKKYLSR